MSRAFFSGLLEAGLRAQGWQEGRNLLIDHRWNINTPDPGRTAVTELLALQPDVLLITGSTVPVEAAKLTSVVPIVFALAVDPVGLGLVNDLAHPNANVTGFTNVPQSIAGRWVEILKELAPDVTTAGFMYNPDMQTGRLMLPVFQQATAALGVMPVPLIVRTVDDVAPAIVGLASRPHSGLVVGSDANLLTVRTTILTEVAKTRLPAVMPHVLFANDGAMITFALDPFDLLRGAADYAGRILNGEKIANLPVQAPTIYTLTINQNTAREQGFTIPLSLLARADQVIG